MVHVNLFIRKDYVQDKLHTSITKTEIVASNKAYFGDNNSRSFLLLFKDFESSKNKKNVLNLKPYVQYLYLPSWYIGGRSLCKAVLAWPQCGCWKLLQLPSIVRYWRGAVLQSCIHKKVNNNNFNSDPFNIIYNN